MSHCLPSKGTVLGLFNIVVQRKFKGQLFTCTFSARRPQGISELYLHCANFSVSDRRQSATIGDYRRQSATIGDCRRQSATIGDCRHVHERKRSKKIASLGFHNSTIILIISLRPRKKFHSIFRLFIPKSMRDALFYFIFYWRGMFMPRPSPL